MTEMTKNETRLWEMLCEACGAFEGEEDSVKEEHADLIARMDALIEEMRPVREYLFDVKMFAAIRVKAKSKDEAIALIEGINANTANLGAWPNGDPIICEISTMEDSSGGKGMTVVEVDGVAV